ncbi:expressed unknown protein [Seminavis robusta]|uniref:Uncharacterized protein n=1 Tax=Seminavis robusta TaxID=568900 RepID=A0A9N8I1S2_9STRA|nr:expressed unknown protein [Seminavis robusta]|eukprot:Sro4374_g353860.1 n/a (211) ;mRNA; f:341-973
MKDLVRRTSAVRFRASFKVSSWVGVPSQICLPLLPSPEEEQRRIPRLEFRRRHAAEMISLHTVNNPVDETEEATSKESGNNGAPSLYMYYLQKEKANAPEDAKKTRTEEGDLTESTTTDDSRNFEEEWLMLSPPSLNTTHANTSGVAYAVPDFRQTRTRPPDMLLLTPSFAHHLGIQTHWNRRNRKRLHPRERGTGGSSTSTGGRSFLSV